MAIGRKPVWDEKIAPRMEEIKGWARDGYTDDQIAELLGVHRATWFRYKAAKSDLRDALKITKEIADLAVENSLYKRACGLKITETITETDFVIGPDGQPIPTGKGRQKKIVKEIPPDPTSGFFWLQNRQRGKWMDRKSIEITGKNGGPIEQRRLNKKDYIKIREQMLKNDDC